MHKAPYLYMRPKGNYFVQVAAVCGVKHVGSWSEAWSAGAVVRHVAVSVLPGAVHS